MNLNLFSTAVPGYLCAILPYLIYLIISFSQASFITEKKANSLLYYSSIVSVFSITVFLKYQYEPILLNLYIVPIIAVFDSQKLWKSLFFISFTTISVTILSYFSYFVPMIQLMLNIALLLTFRKFNVSRTDRNIFFIVYNTFIFSYLGWQSYFVIIPILIIVNTTITALITLTVFILQRLHRQSNNLRVKLNNYQEHEKDFQIGAQLAKITHEIKNPIAVIKGNIDLMDFANVTKCENSIVVIKSELDRILDLMNDYLSVSRIDLHNINYLDLELVMNDVLRSYDSLMRKRRIKVSLLEADFDPIIMGDYSRMYQVFLNIVKNAIEAMESIEEDGRLDIWYTKDDDKVKIHIKDNGIGMDTEVLSKCNELFYTTKINGTGVGMTLIYEIVKLHKGSVRYISEYRNGTEVILAFNISLM